MVKSKKIIYAKAFDGEPTPENFRLDEFDLAPLKDGEVLCAAEYLSVDPYMRPYMRNYPVGTTMIGGQVAKVIESKNSFFPVNSYLFGQFGWQTHTIFKPKDKKDLITEEDKIYEPYLLSHINKMNVPLSLGLGYLGMPGNTAYFGFLDICKPKSGETVVVTAAAGAVGSLVGQIAKIKGCSVIGIAGSDEKCNWLKKQLNFDHVINYKTANIAKSLKEAAPNGIDCYFDNVGGEISSIIISQMNLFGRISVCGAIVSYNSVDELPKATMLQSSFVWKQLKMEGFIVRRWVDRYSEAQQQLVHWLNDGKIKYNETITIGFENMPKAFMEMLKGENIGKAVVKV